MSNVPREALRRLLWAVDLLLTRPPTVGRRKPNWRRRRWPVTAGKCPPRTVQLGRLTVTRSYSCRGLIRSTSRPTALPVGRWPSSAEPRAPVGRRYRGGVVGRGCRREGWRQIQLRRTVDSGREKVPLASREPSTSASLRLRGGNVRQRPFNEKRTVKRRRQW